MVQVEGDKGEILLRDILRRNGEEHPFDAIMELTMDINRETPLIFCWKFVHEFVQAIAAAQAQVQAHDETSQPGTRTRLPEPPFPIPDPLTDETFKLALLEHVRNGRAEPLGTTCLPCWSNELGESVERLVFLEYHPWTKQIISSAVDTRVVTIADIFVLEEQTDILRFAMGSERNLWHE